MNLERTWEALILGGDQVTFSSEVLTESSDMAPFRSGSFTAMIVGTRAQTKHQVKTPQIS